MFWHFLTTNEMFEREEIKKYMLRSLTIILDFLFYKNYEYYHTGDVIKWPAVIA